MTEFGKSFPQCTGRRSVPFPCHVETLSWRPDRQPTNQGGYLGIGASWIRQGSIHVVSLSYRYKLALAALAALADPQVT